MLRQKVIAQANIILLVVPELALPKCVLAILVRGLAAMAQVTVGCRARIAGRLATSCADVSSLTWANINDARMCQAA